jgi:hypothetical protein
MPFLAPSISVRERRNLSGRSRFDDRVESGQEGLVKRLGVRRGRLRFDFMSKDKTSRPCFEIQDRQGCVLVRRRSTEEVDLPGEIDGCGEDPRIGCKGLDFSMC